ncbi:MAG TPA: DUF2321 domain-containing protein, partial [Bryobacteraceae bacterium]|nr:DUF2321 domain-containing protein [Bryobacteraceae bacterium]
GKPFPWTETALATAEEYADEVGLGSAERAELKTSLGDLTSDSARTPLAVMRVKKVLAKIGPEAGKGLLQIVVSVLTEEAKRQFGLK